jgi:hypothetical protein
MKRPRFSFGRHEPVPYLIPSSQGNHEVFLGSLISSWSSGINDHVNEDEDEPSSTYSSPLQRWIDQACGYTFRRDDQADGFSFQQDILAPTHLHEFHFTIDCICIYTHDHFVLGLSLLFHMIKHRGRYFDEMISWLQWLYDFTLLRFKLLLSFISFH